jgi:hypothetical protein
MYLKLFRPGSQLDDVLNKEFLEPFSSELCVLLRGQVTSKTLKFL